MNDLAQIEQFLIERGYSSTRQSMADGAERLICVSHRDSGGRLHGNSVWITRRKSCWLIATWTPRLYKFPEQTSLLQVAECCANCLARTTSPLATVPDNLVAHYGLLEANEPADID
jgi:hypothetical protein